MKRWLCIFVLLLLSVHSLAFAAPVIETERVKVPVLVNGKTYNLDAMIYKPPGEGPFPGMVMTHGTPRDAADKAKTLADNYFVKQCQTFANLGLATIFVVRRGFGLSEGEYAELVPPKTYTQAGLEAARDLKAAVEYLQTKSYVDKNQIVLIGQSTGGFSVTAAGSLNIEGVKAVINFAGGKGSYAPDKVNDEPGLISAFGYYGKTFKVPTVWLYSINDHYFGPALTEKMFSAFIQNGAKAEFITLPPYGNDGHASFARNIDGWYSYVLQFLVSNRFIVPQ